MDLGDNVKTTLYPGTDRSIVAFVFIISLWGIVNLIVNGLGLNMSVPCSDYMIETTDSGCLDGSVVPINGLI